jgi:hypothetical protein
LIFTDLCFFTKSAKHPSNILLISQVNLELKKMNYKKLNNVTGWLVFLVATIVYFMTLESTASLWDCGEYITAAYKLEVGHPPGAPFFMVLGRLFSFFADPSDVAVWINRLSALSSSFTILFMYWSITMLGKKIMTKISPDWSRGDQLAVVAAGVIGSLAYTFSDSFWFSAVEGEVYAMSSLFTAAIFWAILKWDSEMADLEGLDALQVKNAANPHRWIILIVFLLGLSIGVHLLGLLVIPAIIFIIYFRLVAKIKVVPFLLIGVVSLYALNLIQNVIIPNTVGNAALTEVTFANSFNFGFNVGTVFYFLLLIGTLFIPFFVKSKNKFNIILIGICFTLFLIGSMSTFYFILIVVNAVVSLIIYSVTKNAMLSALSAQFSFILGPILFYLCFEKDSRMRKSESDENIALVMRLARFMNTLILVIVMGYGTFSVIVIRSNANTPLDENDPENLVTLHAYLKREQYGTWPILSGPYWNSLKDGEVMTKDGPRMESSEAWGDLSPFYVRRFVVQLDDNDIKAFKNEQHAKEYAKKKGAEYEVTEKYFSSNEKIRFHAVPTYSQSTFLPRMYYTSNDPDDPKIEAYKSWSNYSAHVAEEGATDATNIGTDGQRLPTFGENLTYMGAYQVNWMYWRYFMWNFAGRQNDIQGHGDAMRGNYQTGFAFLDESRLGSQENQPYYTSNNPSNNKFFLLPLVLGILGLVYHTYRDRKGAFVVFLTFLLTGFAIVIYLNQKPFEPRERDYAYAASFYAFAMWIGFGVLAIYDVFKNFRKEDWAGIMKIAAGLTGFVFILTLMGSSTIMITYLFCLLLAALFLLLGLVLKSAKVGSSVAAIVIFLVTMTVPYIMGSQGWDDHNREGKTSARDLANNYLMSCAPNGIIFTVGDNDTFPLWYLQEVEGKYTSIRVCNTSLFDTDWYTDQMKMKAYDSEALPISFREDQILQFEGGTDQALMASTKECIEGGMSMDVVNELNTLKISLNKASFVGEFEKLRQTGIAAISALSSADPTGSASLENHKKAFLVSPDSANAQTIVEVNAAIDGTINDFQTGLITGPTEKLGELQQLQYTWEAAWAYLPIQKAMEVVRNDDNMITVQGNLVRAFPCSGFIVPVDKENAVKSGIISAKEKNKCEKEIRFKMNNRGMTKSDLMILDMFANNNWKRAMYFSSPGGTEVGMSLYKSGCLRQNGMAWEITPVKVDVGAPFNTEAMYTNIMERYDYGKMNQKGVLTDYYARRQTATFRSNFYQLANFYLQEAEQINYELSSYGPQIKRLRASGRNDLADSLERSMTGGTEADISMYKKKAVKLIQRSLEVMPIDLVLDYGEAPTGNRQIQGADGQPYLLYQDGNLHEYVTILYRAGAKKEAEKLGMQVTDQLEATLKYFYSSDAEFAGKNYRDVQATVGSILEMFKISTDPMLGTPDSKLAARLTKIVNGIYGKDMDRIYKELKQYALDNGEGRDGYYSQLLAQLQGHIDAVGIHYEAIEAPMELPQAPIPNQPPMDAVITDSMKKSAGMDETAAVKTGGPL